MRRVMTVVLPVPAPAMMSSGLVSDRRRLGRIQPLEDPLGAPRRVGHQGKLYHR